MKMNPKPSTTLRALGSIGPVARSENSGNSTAPTTIIPATRQAARKANRITKRRPIRAMKKNPSTSGGLSPLHRHARACPGHPRLASTETPEAVDGRERRQVYVVCAGQTTMPGHDELKTGASIRHRHGAQRLPLARRQFFGLRFQLAASGEDVAAARRAHRRGIAGVENIFGEFFDLVPVRALIPGARPRVERNEVDFCRNALEQFYQQF